MDYFQEEEASLRKHFDLEKALEFSRKNDVQIIRGGDYQYQAYINKKGSYATSFTPLHAFWFGMEAYELDCKNEPAAS